MIQVIAVAAIGAIGLYAYSSFRKHMDELKAEEEKKKNSKKEPKTIGDLEVDPMTGRYKVKK